MPAPSSKVPDHIVSLMGDVVWKRLPGASYVISTMEESSGGVVGYEWKKYSRIYAKLDGHFYRQK